MVTGTEGTELWFQCKTRKGKTLLQAVNKVKVLPVMMVIRVVILHLECPVLLQQWDCLYPRYLFLCSPHSAPRGCRHAIFFGAGLGCSAQYHGNFHLRPHLLSSFLLCLKNHKIKPSLCRKVGTFTEKLEGRSESCKQP